MDRCGDALALGVESIDTEHRRLAGLLCEFVVCFQQEGSSERACEIVAAALALANQHFESEEALMATHAYPGIADEKMHHRNLRLQLTTLVGDALTNGVFDATTEENLATMERLLFEHITGPDRVLADYLIARGVR